MMTKQELARSVLEMFKLQRAYFRIRPGEPGKSPALEQSKTAEKALMRECEEIIKELPLFKGDGEHNGDIG